MCITCGTFGLWNAKNAATKCSIVRWYRVYPVKEAIRIFLNLVVTIGGSSFNLLPEIDRIRRNGYISNDSGMRYYKYNV